jgi:hypothetical protein
MNNIFLFRTANQDSFIAAELVRERQESAMAPIPHGTPMAELLLLRLLTGVGGPVLEPGDDFVEHHLDVLL